MKQLDKLFQLTSNERQLIVNTYLLLTTVRLGLWLLTFKTLRQWLAKLDRVNQRKKHTVEPNRITWAVNLAARYQPGRVKCLARALTTKLLLSRQGYPAELRIGVIKPEDTQLLAHAWVESKGKVVIGALDNLEEFQPFSSGRGNL